MSKRKFKKIKKSENESKKLELKKEIKNTADLEEENKISKTKGESKILKLKNKLEEKKKNFQTNKVYIGYSLRVVLYVLSIFITAILSYLFLSKAFNIEKDKIINYQETGNMDYKVYLKENEFYGQIYLDKGMSYIASIIKNVDINMNYKFIIEDQVNTDISYKVIGKLNILDAQGKGKLYERDYVLKEVKNIIIHNQTIHNINDKISIDYDYYNDLANRFKSTYGVDATSNLVVYVVFDKNITSENKDIAINGTNQMSLTIPLSQKTLEINLNDTVIDNRDKIVFDSKVKVFNIVCGVIGFAFVVISVGLVLRLIKLLLLLFPKKSKYDKCINRILNEYDRLIVETPSEPRLEDKQIVVIKKFVELLDVRDNLKRPIMYYNLVSHQKCYFYIENENTIYLLIIKAVDLEEENESKK